MRPRAPTFFRLFAGKDERVAEMQRSGERLTMYLVEIRVALEEKNWIVNRGAVTPSRAWEE